MRTKTDRFYNAFSGLYPLVDVFLRPQKQRLMQEVNCLGKGDLLEIGVGNGSHLPLYRGHLVTGIDTSERMLKRAGRHRRENIRLLQMNGESLLFEEGSFDYVVLSHVLAVVDNPEKLLSETYRVLRPGGRIFILNHFTPGNWLKLVDWSFRPFARLLRFRSVFRISQLQGIERFTPEREIGLGWCSYFKLLIYSKA